MSETYGDFKMRRITIPRLGVLLSSFLLLLFVASSVWAQPGPPTRERQEQRLEKMMADMTEKLSLSEEQAAQIKEILSSHSARQRELFEANREEARESRMQMRDDMKKAREETDAEVKTLLTEEQAEAYEKYMDDHRPGRWRRGPRKGGRRGNW